MTAAAEGSAVRRALRDWVLAAAPDRDAAGLTDVTPLVEERYLTSLQITDLILFIEDLRGAAVSIEELTPGTFRDIDTIWATFFSAESDS